MKRYIKNGGAARRRFFFFAFLERPEGGSQQHLRVKFKYLSECGQDNLPPPHFFPTPKSPRICIDLRGPRSEVGDKLPPLPPPPWRRLWWHAIKNVAFFGTPCIFIPAVAKSRIFGNADSDFEVWGNIRFDWGSGSE